MAPINAASPAFQKVVAGRPARDPSQEWKLPTPPAPGPLSGPLGRRVLREGHRLTAAAAEHGATNLRVFGSVARGAEAPGSDVDLLADLAPGTGMLGLGRLQRDLADILQADVEVVPASDLEPEVAARVLDEAIPL